MDATHIAELAAAGIGIIAGTVQVVEYYERKKRERSSRSRSPYSAVPRQLTLHLHNHPRLDLPSLNQLPLRSI